MGKKQPFGVFGSKNELVKNIPNILLNKVLLPDSQNVLLKDGKIIRRKMREKDFLDGSDDKVQTPDGNPIIHYHKFIKRSTGTQYVLAFTKAHIYHWNPPNFDLKWTNHNITAITIAFNDNGASADTITDSGAGFVTAGFVAGDKITVSGSTSNDGDYTIDTVVAGTITLIATDSLTTEIAGDTVTIVANCDNWETKSYNDMVIATNGIDFVIAWDTTGSFAALDTATGIEYDTGKFLTKCKHLTTYENYLILGYTYEDSKWYPQRMRWNAIGDEVTWIPTGIVAGAGSTEVGKADFIIGFGMYRGYLIVFKETSHFKYWLVGSTYTFNGAFISMTVGCKCNGSIVNDNKGRLYWYASDGTIKEMSIGTISQPIQTEIIDKIYQSSVDLIKSKFIDETEETWWSIPFENTLNNKIVTLKEDEQGNRIWGQVDLAIPAFGEYREV